MKQQPSQSELEVLKVVWGQTEATSQSISDALKASQNWEKSTVKTLLARLVQKGLLTTTSQGRRYIYESTLTETESMYTQLQNVVDTLCATNVGSAIEYLIATYPLSVSDKEKIMSSIEQKAFAPALHCSCVEHHHQNCGCNVEACQCHNHSK